MAQRRVQVERLRAPTSINPVASQVDTYVAPAAESKVKSTAMKLYEAIAPGAAQIIDKQQQEKKQYEAEVEAEAKRKQAEARAEAKRKLAQQQAFQAKLAVTKGNSAWSQYYEQNKNELLTMSIEDVHKKRQEVISPFYSDITDPIVRTAADQDFQLGGIAFEESFTTAQTKVKTDAAISDVFTTMNVVDLPQDKFNVELNDHFKNLKNIYGLDMKALNDYGMQYAYQRVKQGDTRFWEYMKAQKQHQVGDANRQQVVAQIEDELARQAKATAIANKKALNVSLKSEALDNVFADVAVRGGAAIAYPVTYTDADGEEKEISPTQLENFVARKYRENMTNYINDTGVVAGVSRSVREDWAPTGLKNKEWEAILKQSKSHFIVDYATTDREQAVSDAKSGFMLYQTIYAENPSYTQSLMSEDDFKTYRAVQVMIEEQGMEFEQAYELTRSYLTGESKYTVADRSTLVDAIDSRKSKWFNPDISNTTDIRNFVERNAEVYMMNGLDPALAVEQALTEYDERHIRVGNRMVNINGLNVGMSKENITGAFDLMLKDLPEGASFRLIPGQNTRYQAIDEVGIPIYQKLDDEYGTFSITVPEMQQALQKARMLELSKIEADAAEEARIEQLIDQRGEEIRKQTGSFYSGRTWLSRFNIRLDILEEEAAAKRPKVAPLTEQESNPFAISEF